MVTKSATMRADRILRQIGLVHVQIPAWDTAVSEEPASLTHNFDSESLPAGSKLIAMVSDDRNAYSKVAIVKKETRTSTFQSRIRLDQISTIAPISFDSIRTSLPLRSRKHFDNRIAREIASFPNATANELVKVLIESDPGFLLKLRKLINFVDRRPIRLANRSNDWQIMAWEKDALETALRLGDSVRGHPVQNGWENLQTAVPILDLIGGKTPIEDRQIEHDAAVFGGLEQLHADVRGRVFYDRSGGSRVTVINANRGSLEQTLGVDLIVHYERFRSLILVQYKRFTRLARSKDQPAQWQFWPSKDRSFQGEMDRISKIRSRVLGQPIRSPIDYRLSDDPFFFKFCRSESFMPDDTAMTPGLHFLATDVEHFLKSKHSIGPKGGRHLGLDNLDRQLPNTLFLDLARAGWIGSRQLGTEQIFEIVTASLAASNSVMMARISGPQRSTAIE